MSGRTDTAAAVAARSSQDEDAVCAGWKHAGGHAGEGMSGIFHHLEKYEPGSFDRDAVDFGHFLCGDGRHRFVFRTAEEATHPLVHRGCCGCWCGVSRILSTIPLAAVEVDALPHLVPNCQVRSWPAEAHPIVPMPHRWDR